MRRRIRAPIDPDPFDVLGLPRSANQAQVIEARRRLAKSVHPDSGGNVESMQRVNLAAEQALARLSTAPTTPTRRSNPGQGQQTVVVPTRHDHPSFTVEALPVEAFEGLIIVASWIGELVDDDPPYRIEVRLRDPGPGWCALDLVPDAGASSVSLSVASEPGWPQPDIDRVRDVWIDGLNRLDWDQLDRRTTPPS